MNTSIDYITPMMDIIQSQLEAIMSQDPEYYGKYRIILSNEQQYVKIEDRIPKAIYIVVKFMAASINFGQLLLPVNINAVGEENQIEVCQRLLLEFAQSYTLAELDPFEISEDTYIAKQIWQSPQIMSNFNVVSKGFRSLFYMSGTFLLGKNSVPIDKITYFASLDDTTGQDIDFINVSWNFNIQLDSQAFYGTNSRTESRAKIGTLSISLTTYLMKNDICDKIKAISFNDTTTAPNGIKEVFYFSISFTGDGDNPTVVKMPFYLISANATQNLGEFPIMAISFTN